MVPALVTAVLLLQPVYAEDEHTIDDITAGAAILMDADTGQVLYARNIHERQYPASTTKIMTGLLAMENASPDDLAAVSDEAVQIPRNSSHIALTQEEVLPVDSAMYALMLPSANDAANVLAEHVSGSQQAFTARMNQRAKELGAVETHFANAHGLHDEQHYTTAYDLALITRAAIRNEDFLRYFGTARQTIPPTNKQSAARPLTNQQFMLLPDMWVYNPEVIGGKVGYTQEAGHTMSSAARRDGRTLVAVVLHCGIDEKFYDTQALFDYGFDQFTEVELPISQVELDQRVAPLLSGGDPAGEVSFSLEQEAVRVLVPAGTSAADIRLEYHLPDQVEKGGDIEAFITAILPAGAGSGLSQMEIHIPLLAQVDDLSPTLSNGKLEDTQTRGGPPWYVWVLLLPAGLLLWVLIRHQRIRRRAERRRQRHLRVLEERKRRAG